MNQWIYQGERTPGFPPIHIVSDSVGSTARAVARASACAFEVPNPLVEILPEVSDADFLHEQLYQHFNRHLDKYGMEKPFVLFYTVVDPEMRRILHAFERNNSCVAAVDVLEEGINALIKATGTRPTGQAGSMRKVDSAYFKRIEAMEFTISHDDGRNPQGLVDADIVLIGVSRSAKTPTSIYLAQQGYKVANIPLDPKTDPPKEIYDVEFSRLFGLMTSADVLVDIRKRRLGNAQAAVAGSYADYEQVCQDLEKARALMRKLGCIVIRTDRRAIEETAQEILRYYSVSHPID